MHRQWRCGGRRDAIRALVAESADLPLAGRVSASNWKIIENALDGATICGAPLPPRAGFPPAMLYTAPRPAGPSSL